MTPILILNWPKNYIKRTSLAWLIRCFKSLFTEENNSSSIPVSIQTESKYYAIVCGLRLNDATTENAAMEFIALEHNEPRTEMMCYHLGEYYYKKLAFADAVSYYERTSPDNLSNKEIANMKYHQGYAYFTMQRFSDAKPLLDAIRQIPADPNYADANYYYGLSCLARKNIKKRWQHLPLLKVAPPIKELFHTTSPRYITTVAKKIRRLIMVKRLYKKGGQLL